LLKKDKNFKTITFKRNFGQTAAMSAGIDMSQGEVIIPMDADLQMIQQIFLIYGED